MTPNIAFIGVGNMARSIFSGMLASGYPAENMIGTSRTPEKRDYYQQQYGIAMLADNDSAVTQADVVVLCVKPAQMQEVIEAFSASVREDQLFISVAAGVELDAMAHWLGKPVALVRSMPNTPSQLGVGMTGLIANQYTSDEQKTWVSELFSSIGHSVWVDNEEHMHTVTSLSGSAPAYFFRFLESMIKHAQQQGMDEKTSRELASRTMLGAARMVIELDEPIAQLRKNITSPKGTTEQALLSLEASDIDKMVADAMTACINRSKEMAQSFSAKKP
ncbi:MULTISPECIES: pyrroline-5-carboxylate reductase [Marinomonas]|uniref:Pyrroline-5-carboxylate reductase n=1 Tax=Marinomonas arctica TaxID=383750 RepID=A0A7H1J7S2_9GAMM|nr:MULTISPECIES: pyrroline-5-carboxylate reductase [Marinomonas]MCS7487519.1 pyrroline-5-carboxylate reductase [Marinomonas sp. BSi20414]QNT06538.1 pyrroline-5-carboxylate reductase [Marinomonas arctica]GGN35769.1 pyrroline-5-carboxylate reductase [Marinomonas arctica]